jgi:NhaP-type Na+/H+ or K+/H+ antiporter
MIGVLYDRVCFGVNVAAALTVIVAYTWQARRVERVWTWSRVFFMLFAGIVGAWSLIGLTAPHPPVDLLHTIFFGAVGALCVFAAVMVTYLARREIRRSRAAKEASRAS